MRSVVMPPKYFSIASWKLSAIDRTFLDVKSRGKNDGTKSERLSLLQKVDMVKKRVFWANIHNEKRFFRVLDRKVGTFVYRGIYESCVSYHGALRRQTSRAQFAILKKLWLVQNVIFICYTEIFSIFYFQTPVSMRRRSLIRWTFDA